jgi:hypothetical protein
MIGQQVRCSVPLAHPPLVHSELKTPIAEVRAPPIAHALAEADVNQVNYEYLKLAAKSNGKFSKEFGRELSSIQS